MTETCLPKRVKSSMRSACEIFLSQVGELPAIPNEIRTNPDTPDQREYEKAADQLRRSFNEAISTLYTIYNGARGFEPHIGVGHGYRSELSLPPTSSPEWVADQTKDSGIIQAHTDRRFAKKEFPIKAFYPQLPQELIQQKFREAETSVDILQAWTQVGVQFPTWIQYATLKGCRVKILLLNPDSEQVKYLAQALNRDPLKIRYEIIHDLRILSALLAELHEDGYSVEAKLYDSFPTLSMYQFDETYLMGTFWWGLAPIMSPHLELSHRQLDDQLNPLAQQLDNHFQSLWLSPYTRTIEEVLSSLEETPVDLRRAF